MRKIFPFSFKGKNFKAVILSSLIYALIFAAAATVASCLVLFGVIKSNSTLAIVINVIRQIVLLYCASGIVIAVLNACNLLDRKWFE